MPRVLHKPDATPGKQSKDYLLPLLLGLLFVSILAAVIIILYPGFLSTHWGTETVLVIGNERIGEGKVIVEDREIYMDVDTLQAYLDPHFFWDEDEKTAVITTADRVVHMYSEKLTAEINLEPVDLQFPLMEDDGRLYLPLLFLYDFYNLTVDYIEETDTVVIDRVEETAYLATVSGSQPVRLRSGPGIRYPYLAVLEPEAELRLEQEEPGWCLVRTTDGLTGYLQQRRLSIAGAYPHPQNAGSTEKPADRVQLEHPLVVTWEFTYPNPDVNTIGEMPSLHVLSPTWFHVQDAGGNIRNLADPRYVHWAREHGYQVWGLVTNSFSPAITASVLSSSALRKKVIDQLLIYARLYELDGINLDFENFHYSYRDHYTQFVRELAPLCAAEGLTLSVDVTMISGNHYYSLGYDRKALAEAVDYVILMAYDQHWENCPTPGPVAAPPWVERGLKQVLEEVPAEKLILGVPFYTRVWAIDNIAGGDYPAGSRSFSMQWGKQILDEKSYEKEWDSKSAQYMVEYKDGDLLYRFWLEDGATMRQRLELVNRYQLAGVAGWRRGLESPDTWDLFYTVLDEYNDH